MQNGAKHEVLSKAVRPEKLDHFPISSNDVRTSQTRDPVMSVEFLLTSIVVVLLPGTGVLYTLAVGLGRGFRPSIAAAFGCTLGILPAAIASIVGLAAILHTSALAFQIVKFLGVAYLFYMAWSIMKDGGTLDVTEDKAPVSDGRTILNGMLLNVLNPKLSLFFMAFLPQFVPLDAQGATASLVLLAAAFMALTFIIFVGYGACAAMARDYVISRPVVMTWLKRMFAGTFGFLGLRLALSDR
jgi:threonine/homoserine/homoserine lactone efflux protein